MAEAREWLDLLLIPVLIPLFYFSRKGYQQWRTKREAAKQEARREGRRADTYKSEGTAVIERLEFENDELQLELEASEEERLTLLASVTKLADAYEVITGKKVAL